VATIKYRCIRRLRWFGAASWSGDDAGNNNSEEGKDLSDLHLDRRE
jgi:hypothetical protein